MKRNIWFVGAALALLAACAAPGLPAVHLAGTPGFWHGVWHGIIFPVTFIVSLFNHDVGVYAAVNDGGWYNFGFFLGLGISMGGSGGSARAAVRRKKAE